MSLKLPIPAFLAASCFLALAVSVGGQPASNRDYAALAQTAYAAAWKNYLADTNAIPAVRQLAQASFALTDFATNETQRAEFARRGIEACRQWLAREPRSAPAHYYFAMNLGELAQAEAPSLAAYRLVHEVEREFKLAAELDVRFDHAGPARTLGELYFQAPGWPLSVGSKHKAREWFDRAVELAPEYPENQLNLAEAQLKWRQRDALVITMTNLAAIWPAARTNFSGAGWERSWLDWNARRTLLQADFQKTYGGRD